MDGRRIACDRCGAEVGAEERHAEIEYVYGDGGGSMTLCRDCFKLVMDTVHGQEAKRQGNAEPPTMDERRAVARRLREYKCPVMPSHQTTREAVDAAIECMGLEDDEEMCTVRHFLDRLADLIDPGEGMDEDGRAALDWVREHGGLEELEKRLMPEGMEWLVEAWPRFDDGEPVRFLDDFECYGDENGVSVVTMYSDGSFALNFRAYSKGERVRRPAPKVLDVDGVDTSVGDTVYDVDTEEKMWVCALPEQGAYQCVKLRLANGIFKTLDPFRFTHRAPVLAADGRPLREGETVYHVNTGIEYSVRSVTNGGAHLSKGDKPGGYCRADYLTHERPESWERLEEDAGKNPFDYCKDVGHRLDTCEDSEAYKARDLVRRARALAGVGD